jgi:integrative and conjugative element protein (TIGR02256 family)
MKPLETGGVLLGYGVDDDQVVVETMIGPGPRATHRRNRFEPDSRWQRTQIAEAYVRSGRISRYLGDWHSHPGGSANPSRRDQRTARRIGRHRGAKARRPVMLIMSNGSDSWESTPYRLLKGRLIEMAITKS